MTIAEYLGNHITQKQTIFARVERIAFHVSAMPHTHQYLAHWNGIKREFIGKVRFF